MLRASQMAGPEYGENSVVVGSPMDSLSCRHIHLPLALDNRLWEV